MIDPANDFVFLDLIGRVTFSTAASVSFQLGRLSDTIEFPNSNRHYVGDQRVFYGVGWLDAHYPCQGLHKLFIRCSLPGDYVGYESMRDLVPQVCDALGLPKNVPFKIYLQYQGQAACMEDPQEGFVSTTKWRRPEDPE